MNDSKNPSTEPAPAPERIRSIDQLLQSRWGRLAEDPEMRRKIPAMLRSLLERLPSTHPVVNRIRLALRLFEQESAGGLVTSRNLLILSAVLLYTFWPADTIPDLLPLIGWLDDVGLLTLVLSSFARRFRSSPPTQEPSPQNESAEETPPSDGTLHQ